MSLKPKFRNRLYDDEKQLFEASDSILDLAEVNKQLLVLLKNEILFLNATCKVVNRIELKTFGG